VSSHVILEIRNIEGGGAAYITDQVGWPPPWPCSVQPCDIYLHRGHHWIEATQPSQRNMYICSPIPSLWMFSLLSAISNVAAMSISSSEATSLANVNLVSETSIDHLESEHAPPDSDENSVQGHHYPDNSSESCEGSNVISLPLHREPELQSTLASVSLRNSPTPQPELRNPDFGYVDLFAPWFPKIDPDYHQARGIRSWRIWHSKRHIVLWTAFTISMIVLLANFILVTVLGSKYGIRSERGLITLYKGDCNRVKMIGTASHVGINILSTLLLGASNLCMQLLVAPTRDEIDAAHRKKVWLDIGIPSWKNIRNIKPSRRWLFFFLMLSSVPLHFM